MIWLRRKNWRSSYSKINFSEEFSIIEFLILSITSFELCSEIIIFEFNKDEDDKKNLNIIYGYLKNSGLPGPFLKRDYVRFGVDVLKKNFLLN